MSAALKMTPAQRKERAAEKRNTLLSFLASGEVYTTLKVASVLLKTSERNALRLLQSLVKEKALAVDERVVGYGGAKLKIYGITWHSLCVMDANPSVKPFAIGKLNTSYLNHHLQTQLLRIKCEEKGWKSWIPGKVLLNTESASRLKKVPDAIGTAPNGRKVAIEVELSIKSKKRFADVIALHIKQIHSGLYDLVYYFTPHQKP